MVLPQEQMDPIGQGGASTPAVHDPVPMQEPEPEPVAVPAIDLAGAGIVPTPEPEPDAGTRPGPTTRRCGHRACAISAYDPR